MLKLLSYQRKHQLCDTLAKVSHWGVLLFILRKIVTSWGCDHVDL